MRILGDKTIEKDADRLAVILAGSPGIQQYVRVTPTHLWDSGPTNQWSGGYNANIGTYTFRPQDNSNLWPSNAKAVIILIGAMWAAAATSSTLSARISGGTANEIQVRAFAASVLIPAQGFVQVDGNGYFDIAVSGANATNSVCRLLGYFL